MDYYVYPFHPIEASNPETKIICTKMLVILFLKYFDLSNNLSEDNNYTNNDNDQENNDAHLLD